MHHDARKADITRDITSKYNIDERESQRIITFSSNPRQTDINENKGNFGMS